MEDLRAPVNDEVGSLVKERFKTVLKTYTPFDPDELLEMSIIKQQMHNYPLQIFHMVQNNKSTIYVDFTHIAQVDHELSEAIEIEYYRFEPFLRQAIQEMVAEENQHYIVDPNKGQREFFVSFYNQQRTERIRSMTSDKIGRMISISGTVTRSSEVRPELLFGNFICIDCQTKIPNVEQQYQFTEPVVCRNAQCSKGTGGFQLMMDKSAFVDWQRLRVQENADEIPAGSMPRCIDVICRNEVVEVAKAGDKVVLTGTVAVIPDCTGLARVGESTVSGKPTSGRGDSQFNEGVSGIKKLGVKELTYKLMFVACSVQNTDQRTGSAVANTLLAATTEPSENGGNDSDFRNSMSEADTQAIIAMRNTPHLYTKMYESMCPSVFGHSDVKRGILLMLFGGVHKKTQEGISLRGDLNVCIVGDPSCAKSQFLKYVHGFLPRTVYTSGKSSSAAGLTASVVRDAETGEFCVEAGALMLADNGICCIDEFDKMEPTDQVAIHEAMEQQTISITKAGIQATLNARTSILAAANPVFGRYDRTKTLKANVAVSAAIMSRFDLFFVILDECDPVSDAKIAKHIISVHREGGIQKAAENAKFSREQIQKYIQFARCLNPRMTRESRKVLVECYRMLRGNDILGKNKTAYRITVRQLESLVRLSEALARLHLDETVKEVYVREAYRLLQKSIIFVETEDVELEDNEEGMDEIMRGGDGKRKPKRPRGGDGGGGGQGGPDDDDNDQDQEGEDFDEQEEYFRQQAEAQRAMESAQQEDEEETYRQQAEAFENVTRANNNTNSNSSSSGSKGTEEQTAPQSEPTTTASAPPAAKKQKVKSHISAEEYDQATHLLVLRLKFLEDSSVPGAVEGEEGFYEGEKWSHLLGWFLRQYEADFETQEQLLAKQKQISQVIRRMIKHEATVMIVDKHTEGYDALPNEEKLIRLHPSYQG